MIAPCFDEPGTVYVAVGTDCSCDTSWVNAVRVTVTVSTADCQAGIDQSRELMDAFEEEKKIVEGEDVRPVFPRVARRLATSRHRERLQLESTYG